MLDNYVRFSNVSAEHVIADVGSELENDAGTMGGYSSINLDRKLYDYNCYHFTFGSLGTDLASYLRLMQSSRTGFTATAPIRTQPMVTNLLSANDTALAADYSAMLPDLAVLNWEFGLSTVSKTSD